MAKKELTQASYDVDNVQSLPVQVKGQASLVQQTFDKASLDARTYNNDTLLSELADETLDASGSHTIGHNSTNITADNVGDALTENRQAIVDAILGQIPDGSLTDVKLSNDTGQVKDRLSRNDANTAQNGKDIARLELAVRKNGIVTGDNITKWFESPDVRSDESVGLIDFGKAYASSVTTGINTVVMDTLLFDKDGVVPTNLSDCFVVGDEVTLQDDTTKENLIVSNVDDGTKTLTFTTNIVGTYSTGANIYRSNMVVNGTVWNFGAFSASETIDRTTPTQVINQALTNDQENRPVRLDSGRLIKVLNDSDTNLEVLYSDDNGDNWDQLCFASNGGYLNNGISVVTDGINVTVMYMTSNTIYVSNTFNGDTQTNVDISGNSVTIDSGQSGNPGSRSVSLAIALNGDLHAALVSKNATAPDSFNIRYSKSTDGGATWDSPTQVTSFNSTGANGYGNPSIVIDSTGNPHVLCNYASIGPDYRIRCVSFNGTSWNSAVNVYQGGTHTQSSPSADVLSDGTIIVAWQGRDATDTSDSHIRFSQSDDNGVTWSSMEKLESGPYDNGRPSITRDTNDKIFITYFGQSVASPTIYQIKLIEGVSGLWETPVNITNDTSNALYPSSCSNYRNFEKPLTVWQDGQDSDVKFCGEWTEGVEVPLTDIDIRINMSQPDAITSIQAFTRVDELTGLTVDASGSVVGASDNESYTDMTDTTTDLGDENEISSSLVTTSNDKVTVKYNMTRLLTTDEVKINDFVGFVGV